MPWSNDLDLLPDVSMFKGFNRFDRTWAITPVSEESQKRAEVHDFVQLYPDFSPFFASAYSHDSLFQKMDVEASGGMKFGKFGAGGRYTQFSSVQITEDNIAIILGITGDYEITIGTEDLHLDPDLVLHQDDLKWIWKRFGTDVVTGLRARAGALVVFTGTKQHRTEHNETTAAFAAAYGTESDKKTGWLSAKYEDVLTRVNNSEQLRIHGVFNGIYRDLTSVMKPDPFNFSKLREEFSAAIKAAASEDFNALRMRPYAFRHEPHGILRGGSGERFASARFHWVAELSEHLQSVRQMDVFLERARFANASGLEAYSQVELVDAADTALTQADRQLSAEINRWWETDGLTNNPLAAINMEDILALPSPDDIFKEAILDRVRFADGTLWLTGLHVSWLEDLEIMHAHLSLLNADGEPMADLGEPGWDTNTAAGPLTPCSGFSALSCEYQVALLANEALRRRAGREGRLSAPGIPLTMFHPLSESQFYRAAFGLNHDRPDPGAPYRYDAWPGGCGASPFNYADAKHAAARFGQQDGDVRSTLRSNWERYSAHLDQCSDAIVQQLGGIAITLAVRIPRFPVTLASQKYRIVVSLEHDGLAPSTWSGGPIVRAGLQV